MTTNTEATAVAEAAALGRRTAEARVISETQVHELPFVVTRVLEGDERLYIEDLEEYAAAPRQRRGHSVLHNVESFTSYLDRLHDPATTTVWADRLGDDRSGPVITAIFNDHHSTADPDGANWRDHRAVLRLPRDPDWAAWTARDDSPLTQTIFAGFFEDQLHTVVDPPATQLIGAITTFTAKRSVHVESSTVLQSGQVQFAYIENVEGGAKGNVTLPQQLTLSLTPFVGLDPVEVSARLRFRTPRTENDSLALMYRLHRPDLIEADAFDRVCADVIEHGPSDVPLLYGAAPAALR